MTLKRAKQQQDAGFAEIAAWHQTFLNAHIQSVTDRNLPPDEHDRALAEVTRIAATLAERLRADYLARRKR